METKTKEKIALPRKWEKSGAASRPALQTRRRLKRNRIAAAASELFAKQGFARTTINQIASRAGIATGTVYQHFRSKRHIISSIMISFFDDPPELPPKLRDPRSAIRIYLAQFVRPELSQRCAFRAWQEIVSIDSDLARQHDEIDDRAQVRTTQFFVGLQKLPGARRDLNVERLANLVNGSLWNLLGRAPRMARSELDAYIDTTADLIYCGFFTTGQKTLR